MQLQSKNIFRLNVIQFGGVTQPENVYYLSL